MIIELQQEMRPADVTYAGYLEKQNLVTFIFKRSDDDDGGILYPKFFDDLFSGIFHRFLFFEHV